MKIIISAFECSPYRGSEAGLGWNWVTSAYENIKIEIAYVLTCERYEREILDYLDNHIELKQKIKFIFIPLPLKNLKHLNVRFKYIIWQRQVGQKAKEIAQKDSIDFCHRVAWASCVLPSYLHESGVPFVYGPVGGGERIPRKVNIKLSLRDKLVEQIRNAVAGVSVYLPANRKSYQKAALILATTEETKRLIPKKYHNKLEIMQSIGVHGEHIVEQAVVHDNERFTVLLAGRMIYWKGVEIAIEAFRKISDENIVLKIAGDGLKFEKYKCMVANDKNIEILGNLPFNEMNENYCNSDCLLNCSLHDSGCMVVLEAMSQGLPVVAIATGGQPC